MNRRDVVINSVKLMGLALLAPTLAKASEHFDLSEADVDLDRSSTLVETLELSTGKAYRDIIPEDLAKLENMTLEHIHIKAFSEGDFSGLDNLKSLNVTSIFHGQAGVVDNPAVKPVFASLRNLETLVLKANQFSNALAADLFAPLVSLKTLDLTLNRFDLFPESVFTSMPKLEVIKVTKNAVTPELFNRLQSHFGDRLQA